MYKILFIANEFQTGGATKSLIGLAKCLKEEFNVEPIIFVNKMGYLTDMCEKYSIKYYKIHYKSFVIGAGNTKFRKLIKKILLPIFKIRHIIFTRIALKQAKYILKKNKIDIIHTNTNRDDFGAILAQKYNIPHIWHLREFGENDYECIFLRKDYINYMNKFTTNFIAISKVIKDYFITKGIEKNKVELIYNGIHINQKTSKKIINNDNKMKIVFLGGICNNKGQYQLIDSLKYLPKEVRNNIIIDFYGNGSEKYINYLKSKVKNLELGNNIKFYGYCNDIDEKINTYDVGIMCSKSEAFGRVTIEYMTNNLITIASDTGANPELIDNGKNGFLYKYDNIKSLADVLLTVYNLPQADRDTIIQNGYLLSKSFSDRNNALNIYNLYKKILN